MGNAIRHMSYAMEQTSRSGLFLLALSCHNCFVPIPTFISFKSIEQQAKEKTLSESITLEQDFYTGVSKL